MDVYKNQRESCYRDLVIHQTTLHLSSIAVHDQFTLACLFLLHMFEHTVQSRYTTASVLSCTRAEYKFRFQKKQTNNDTISFCTPWYCCVVLFYLQPKHKNESLRRNCEMIHSESWEEYHTVHE
jgi:hypothetical protein